MLIVNGSDEANDALNEHFTAQGFDVDCAVTSNDARTFLAAGSYSIVISELDLDPLTSREGLEVMFR